MNTQEFLGLRATHNPHRWFLPVEKSLCVREGFLFGGCGLAAAVTALESTAQRPLVWATAQYLSFARPPSYVDIDVTIPVAGRQTTQARAIGRVGDQEILTVNAALGSRPMDIEEQWAVQPQVPLPEECAPVPRWPDSEGTVSDRMDIRVVQGRFGSARDGSLSPDGRSILWLRVKDDVEMSPAILAIMADWMPSAVGQALGRVAHCTSLDNTIRILGIVPTEWVLCDIRVDGVRNGFGHGFMRLWSRKGDLLAIGSQSLIVRLRN
jgi:acyl-CoA thioesterase